MVGGANKMAKREGQKTMHLKLGNCPLSYRDLTNERLYASRSLNYPHSQIWSVNGVLDALLMLYYKDWAKHTPT